MEAHQDERSSVFGRMLTAFMERAGIPGPAELIARMRALGYGQLSEGELIAEMRGLEEGRPEYQGWGAGLGLVLGLEPEEAGRLACAAVFSSACPE